MALLLLEGFDSEGETYDTTFFNAQNHSSAAYFGSTYGRNGTRGVYLNDVSHYWSEVKLSEFTSGDTLILGLALNVKSTPHGTPENNFRIKFMDILDSQVEIRFLVDATIAVYRGDGTLIGASQPNRYSIGEYFYFEVKVKIHDSLGTVSAYVNGIKILDLIGLDTQTTTNNYSTAIRFYGDDDSGVYSDDWYICNTAGTTHNDFLGEVKVVTLRPTADGTYSQFTPSAAVDHYTLVDEELASGTDYVSGETIGDKESFTFETLAPEDTIHGVSVSINVNSSDAVSVDVKSFVKQGATEAASASRVVTDTVVRREFVYEIDPTDSTAWTTAKVNSAEFGIEVV